MEICGLYDYVVYTDGSYSIKHGVGAFAYVMLDGDEMIKKGVRKRKNETNNRMELKAILYAVYEAPENCHLLVRSDSQYAIGLFGGKHKNFKANLDLYILYDDIVYKKKLKVSYEWVRGHNGDYWNEYCDNLCSECAGVDFREEYEHLIRNKTLKYEKNRTDRC